MRDYDIKIIVVTFWKQFINMNLLIKTCRAKAHKMKHKTQSSYKYLIRIIDIILQTIVL